MKRRAVLLLAGLAAVAAAIVLFTFPANEDAEFPGYMEADLVLVGSEQGGRVLALSVEEGTAVKQSDPVFPDGPGPAHPCGCWAVRPPSLRCVAPAGGRRSGWAVGGARRRDLVTGVIDHAEANPL